MSKTGLEGDLEREGQACSNTCLPELVGVLLLYKAGNTNTGEHE